MPANVQHISQLASVVESTDGAKHVAEQHPAIRSSERLVGDAARLNQAVALKHLAVFVAEASFDDTGVSCTKGFVNAGNRARFDFEKNQFCVPLFISSLQPGKRFGALAQGIINQRDVVRRDVTFD